jgi:hypothetical protein
LKLQIPTGKILPQSVRKRVRSITLTVYTRWGKRVLRVLLVYYLFLFMFIKNIFFCYFIKSWGLTIPKIEKHPLKKCNKCGCSTPNVFCPELRWQNMFGIKKFIIAVHATVKIIFFLYLRLWKCSLLSWQSLPRVGVPTISTSSSPTIFRISRNNLTPG